MSKAEEGKFQIKVMMNKQRTEEVKLQIKVVMNKQRTKVLFAEAGSDFTDVLLSFLLLPLGTILKVLEKHDGDGAAPAIGSLNALHKGGVDLDRVHFQTEAAKQKLLAPTSCYEAESRKLRLNVNYPLPTGPNSAKRYEGVFTETAASFIIGDDLRVVPNVMGSFMETLRSLDIDGADMDGVETRNVAFGLKEIVALLKESLVSRNPLTAFLINGRRVGLAEKQGYARVAHWIDEKVASVNTKKMVLRAMMQKSTNKLVFAQADSDFVNFLFSMLMVPLGRMVSYLGGDSGLTAIDNLHRSVADESKKVQLKSVEARALLTMSNFLHVAPNELSRFNFDPEMKNSPVKGVRMYMVSDDLTVAPLGMTSCISVLDGLRIAVSDVEEVEVQVGLAEGLSIAKAALTSTTALTDGLIKHMMKASLTSKSALSGDVCGQSPMKRPKLEC